ncbi:glycosyltransferase [Rhodohalobacter barkolensis]|uniref:Glycosyl transferase family 1 domain-containing protein n=1 Tax=Rhodohalobacter barkolensis TaxID=2053187 RepID=A0A2N0VGE1_9BACT|nr:glycosyltransferase [Rhodohalobacter barkolensis]PKD43266.1 hypothetical protein CWD77_11670 [Rhodohalobacter barkolensis]
MKYRIVFVLTPAFDPNAGGVQRTTFKLGNYFTNQGHEVAYYSFSVGGHTECQYGELFHSRQPGGCSNRENLNYLEEVCVSFNPDFVINQMPYDYPITERLGKLKKTHDFILLGCLRNSLFSVVNNLEKTMQEMLPDSLFKLFNNPVGRKMALERHKYLHRKSLKHILSNHDRYILLSPPNNKELKYFVGDFMQEKVLAIPNSIPEVQDEPGEKEKIILHVGRLNDDQKRSDLLLPFWKACKDRLLGWKFVVVGDGPYMAEMKEQISQQKIDRITLKGFQKPESYYKKASIFMMPSAYEGFPNTILEAQSYGCPVLAYKSYDALSWIVNDGTDAFLTDPYRVDEMADSAVALATNEKERMKAQSAALVNAARFTIDKVGEQWEELFGHLADV